MLQVIGHHAVGVGPEVHPRHRSVDGHLLVVSVSRLDFVLLNDYSILTEVYLPCRWLHACGSSEQTGFRLLLNDYSILTEVYLQCRWLHARGSSEQTGFRLAQ